MVGEKELEKGVLITNIQRFCLHDGPGIRTTVFLKGCSLHCPWCSNPENIISKPQHYMKDGRERIYGEYITQEDLLKECLKDRGFYDGKLVSPLAWSNIQPSDIELLPGGVTFSGGEALLQIGALSTVCRQLKEEKVHIAVETCLFCTSGQIQMAIGLIDLFYVDVKIMDKLQCSLVEKGNLEIFLSNLDLLMKSDKNVIIRVPVIGTYTDEPRNRQAIKELLNKYKDRILKIELIKEHNLGESKYRSLGWKVHYNGVKDELMDQYKEELASLGLPIEICKI